jgi:hypothetical protein
MKVFVSKLLWDSIYKLEKKIYSIWVEFLFFNLILDF